MKKLYFDCSNGVSGDMVLGALEELNGETILSLNFPENEGKHIHEHGDEDGIFHNHSHGRSFKKVAKIIELSSPDEKTRKIAKDIYQVIAVAEAKVHEATLETVHFHEVGRDEAILNVINVANKVASNGIEEIYVTKIVDGKGFVECSHGRIPVPVPAVCAIMENCDLEFDSCQVETEMVTPSGLAMLVGLGSKSIDQIPDEAIFLCEKKGKRDIGRQGLKVYLLED